MTNFNTRLTAIKETAQKISSDVNNIAKVQEHGSIRPLKEELLLQYKKRLLANLQTALEKFTPKPNNKDFIDVNLLTVLAKILEENWQLVKNNLCRYTALPQDELTWLLCDITELLAESEHDDKSHKSAIDFLMPGILTESAIDGVFKDLTELPLKDVLRTHITSDCGNYLIPVRILVTPANEEHPNYNAYYSLSLQDKTEYTPEERDRLYQHSPETQALSAIQTELSQFEKDEVSLLGQLQKLQLALYLRSTCMAGKEEDAEDGTYAAISLFKEYWDLLPEESKDVIPQPVTNEINLLLNVASPDEKRGVNEHRNQARIMATCIATRSQELRRVLAEHRDSLAIIRPDSGAVESRIKTLQDNRKKAQQALQSSLEKTPLNYAGQDMAGITWQLLQTLKVRLDIKSFDLLSEFVKNTPTEEIKELRKLKGIADDFSRNIRSFDDLVFLLLLAGEEKCRVLMPIIEKRFLEIVSNGDNLAHLILHLSPKIITEIFESMGDKLLELIKKRESFVNILRCLNKNQRMAVYTSIKGKLEKFITASDLANILRNYKNQYAEIYENFKDELPQIIRTVPLHICLDNLDAAQCITFFATMKDKLPPMIKYFLDLMAVLIRLSNTERMALLASMNDQLPPLIQTPGNLAAVFCDLDEDTCRAVCAAITKDKLVRIIKTVPLHRFLANLNEAQRRTFFAIIEDKLPPMIEDFSTFMDVFIMLPYPEHMAFFASMKDKPLQMCKDMWDVKSVFSCFSNKDFSALYPSIEGKIPTIINTASALEELLRNFEENNPFPTYARIKDKLPQIITHVKDFSRIAEVLSDKQLSFLFQIESITKKYLDLHSSYPEHLRDKPLAHQAIFKSLSGNPEYKQKWYLLNGGGKWATCSIFGFFKCKPEKESDDEINRRAKINHHGASARCIGLKI